MGKLYGAGTCVTLKGFQGMSQSRRKTGRGVRVGTLRTGGRFGSVEVCLASNTVKLQLL